MLIAAVQRLAAQGALPVAVRFVIDGEEECGGESAVRFVADDPTPADAAVIFDAPMIGPGRPMICAGLRGLVYRRVSVRTAPQDAHSGLYGGAGLNAAHVLVRLLDGLIARDGVLHPELCVGIAEPAPDERAAWAQLPTGAQMLADAALAPADARAADEFYRRTVAAPSLEVHGLSCGEPTAVKTNLASAAAATLSLRVAPGQDAHALAATLDRLILAAAPEHAEVAIDALGVADPALCDPRDPVLRAAAAGHRRLDRLAVRARAQRRQHPDRRDARRARGADGALGLRAAGRRHPRAERASAGRAPGDRHAGGHGHLCRHRRARALVSRTDPV